GVTEILHFGYSSSVGHFGARTVDARSVWARDASAHTDDGHAAASAAHHAARESLLRRGMDGGGNVDGSSDERYRARSRRDSGREVRRLSVVRQRLPRELGHRERDASADAHLLWAGRQDAGARPRSAGASLLTGEAGLQEHEIPHKDSLHAQAQRRILERS